MTAYVPGVEETDLKKLILSLQQLAAGRSNATGSVTLTANAASTVVSNDNFAAASVMYFTATTSNAATEIGNGTLYVSARAKGSFTITHANNAQVDRTFLYAIQG
jgi:hypothetical protein